jgi:Domain of unknown function (DUF305)
MALSNMCRPIGLTVAAALVAIGMSRAPAWAQEAPAPAATAEAPFLAENNAAMDKMMTDMAVKPMGDVDHDFVAMMVPHHQGAIDMAQAELQYGQNPQLKTIAQEIIVDQMQEIALMRLALGEPLPPSTSSPTQATSGAMQSAPHESDAKQTQMRMSAAMQISPALTH